MKKSYEVLSSTIINGKRVEFIKFNYSFLRNLKRHKCNRSDGSGDTFDEYHSDDEIRKGKNHRNEVRKSIEKRGFDPTAKIIQIGCINGDFYVADGQNTRGAVIDINEEELKRNGSIKYDTFIGEIIHYPSEIEFKSGMLKMNYANKKWAPNTYSDQDEDVLKLKMDIRNSTGLTDSQILVLMFGDLGGGAYEDKTMKDVKTFIDKKKKYFNMIKDVFYNRQRETEYKRVLTKGDYFIKFSGLIDDFYNYPRLHFKGLGAEKCEEWSDNAMMALVNFFENVNFDVFNSIMKNPDAAAGERKRFCKNNIHKLFNKEGKKIFSKEQKACIQKWYNDGINNG